jgi:hypothetical protein
VAVDAVVRGHHSPHAGLDDDRLKRRQIQLAKAALVDARVQGHPLGF